jgi:septal ring-binding cell division protein DamX
MVSGDADDTMHLYVEGMAAFNREDFDRAFHTWWSMLTASPDHFVLQVEVDTFLASAQATVAKYGDHSLYVVKKDDLHWVFSGLFETRAKAIEALKLLPEPLRQGGAFPIAVRQIVPQR